MPLKTTDYTGALDRDMLQEIILQDMPHEAALYSWLVARGQTSKTGNVKVEWQTAPRPVKRTQIDNGGAAYDDTTTTLVVDDSSVFFPGAIILCETGGERMLCLTVASSTQITVRRGVGVAAAAGGVANNTWLQVVGHASGEGSNFPDARLPLRSDVYNLIQQFKVPVEITGDRRRSATLVENEQGHQRKWALKELVQLMGAAIIHGTRNSSATDSDGKIVKTMGGLRSVISTNVQNQAGTLTLAQFKTFCSTYAFARGSSEKLFIMGPLLHDIVHTFYENRLQVEQLTNATGFRLSRLVTPSGDLLLVKDSALNGAFAGSGIVIDPERVQLRHHPERDKNGNEVPGDDGMPVLKENLQLNGQDTSKEGYEARLTLEYGDENDHAHLYGVTAAA